MVRFPIPTGKQIFPPLHSNSKKHHIDLLRLCSSTYQLFQIHAHLHGCGLHEDTFLLSELVRFCALSSSKHLSYARTILLHSNDSISSSWNMLIRGYASSDSPKEAVHVFGEMRKRGIRPNKLTFPFLIKGCATSSAYIEGCQVHGEVVKCGLDSDVYVLNNLVHFYGSCLKVLDSRNVFDEMPYRTVVSWNTVITAYVENSLLDEAIGYFFKMMDFEFEPDETTMVVVISACAELGNLSLGICAHSQVIGRGLVLNVKLGTALVDMYAKCGGLSYARLVFSRMNERNVWTWSSMISGLAQHGYADEALELFSKMMSQSSIRPNYVTFLGVLTACSHSGLVEDGYKYFHEMEHKHRIKPMMTHYGAMVDILGRSGRLNEAYTFIMNMPIEPDSVVWRTLLSACSIHGVRDREGVGEKVKEILLEMEPKRCGNFVIVANMYSEAGMWEKAADVRRVMKNRMLKKNAGESCLELGGSIHRFFSGYDSRSDFESLYHLLDFLNLQMKLLDECIVKQI